MITFALTTEAAAQRMYKTRPRLVFIVSRFESLQYCQWEMLPGSRNISSSAA